MARLSPYGPEMGDKGLTFTGPKVRGSDFPGTVIPDHDKIGIKSWRVFAN